MGNRCKEDTHIVTEECERGSVKKEGINDKSAHLKWLLRPILLFLPSPSFALCAPAQGNQESWD